ncbi:MAG TPA: FHA domain-containing protein [Myxococcales bacterium]
MDAATASFLVKAPNGQEKAYPMKAEVVIIGRSDRCDIAVKDGSMSGRHAEISTVDGEIRVKDLGSANGIWLNGERVEDVELFDGDVLRCGQTSIRVDMPGGRKRPEARIHTKLLVGIVTSVLLLTAAGVVLGITLKRRAQRRRDLTSVASFASETRASRAGDPCAVAQDEVGDAVRTLGALGHPGCTAKADGERLSSSYRKLANGYEDIALSVSRFVAQSNAANAALSATADQIADPELKGRVLEALDTVIDQRAQVTSSFISDWKRLGQSTSDYAASLERALVRGDKTACAEVEKGIAGETPQQIVQACVVRRNAARAAVDEKLKDLDAISAGAEKE